MGGSTEVFDPALSGLSVAFDPDAMSPRLDALLDGRDDGREDAWRVVGVELLKHKPGRRCAMAYTVERSGERRRLFAKTFKNDRGARTMAHTALLADVLDPAGSFVPRPLGYLAEIRMLVTEFVEGRELATALYDGASDEPARRMAGAVADLHASKILGLRAWDATREMENTADWVAELRQRDATVWDRARPLLDPLWKLAAVVAPPSGVPVHRDFYPEQMIDAAGRTALLDLDDARVGDPAVDLGNFVAHLELRSLQFPHTHDACARARGVFLGAYRRRCAGAPGSDSLAARLRFYEGASLLRLAGVYGCRERWAATLPTELLAACERVVTRGEEA